MLRVVAVLILSAHDVQTPSLGHIVENRLTLQALLTCAESCPQVEVLWEHGLAAMTFIDGGWEIGCDGGKSSERRWWWGLMARGPGTGVDRNAGQAVAL